MHCRLPFKNLKSLATDLGSYKRIPQSKEKTLGLKTPHLNFVLVECTLIGIEVVTGTTDEIGWGTDLGSGNVGLW